MSQIRGERTCRVLPSSQPPQEAPACSLHCNLPDASASVSWKSRSGQHLGCGEAELCACIRQSGDMRWRLMHKVSLFRASFCCLPPNPPPPPPPSPPSVATSAPRQHPHPNHRGTQPGARVCAGRGLLWDEERGHKGQALWPKIPRSLQCFIPHSDPQMFA